MCMVLVGCRFCDRYDQQGLPSPIIIGNRYVYIPNSMFHVSFWCVAFPVSIPEIKWSCYPDVFLHYVCEGVWFILNFHVMLTISFIVTRALFRVLCSVVFVSVFSLRVKLMETVLQLVILVATVIVGSGCVLLVRSAVPTIEILSVWVVFHIFHISIFCVSFSTVVGRIIHVGCYCYR